MPKIVPGTRGPEGTWRKGFQKAKTYIHVNQHRIRDNQTKKDEDKEPVICVRRGDRVEYCDQVDILGGLCRVVYEPNNCKPCGARVWIEIDPIVAQIIAMANPLATHSFKLHLAGNKSSNLSETGNKSG